MGIPVELTQLVYCNPVKLNSNLDKKVSTNTFEFAASIFQKEGFKVLALASVFIVAHVCVNMCRSSGLGDMANV